MKEQNHCPQCGSDLLPSAPHGLCPSCLMKAGLPKGTKGTVDKPPMMEGPGTRVGRYELLELIGEGGMGVVYLAEQREPIRRKIALKIVKLGMDTMQVVARFEAEQQALAMLDHPNIAKVFDAGTTASGRPYFVMEYVEGRSITKYCDEHKLSVSDRLRLFKEACEGVHHAHQKGIIHRDIKPSNILVCDHGDRAVPKIIDFGVAKAVSEPLVGTTSFTREGQLLGTPEYMSPEQVDLASVDIDTRSDIYSLGVLLYELLAGVLPFDRKAFERAGLAEIQRTIQEEEPTPPSTRLTGLGEKAQVIAERRRTQLFTLARCLQRELEWIPMKAIRKDRARRYRSASELADDIENYLTGAPLMAGPESPVYRARKFMRRHAGSVTMAALVAIAIILGLVASIVMGCRAERAREKAVAARTQVEQALARAENAERMATQRAEDYRRSLYAKDIALAEVAYRDSDIGRLRKTLDSCPEDLRAWEWHRLDHLADQSSLTLYGHKGLDFAVSPDGKSIASRKDDKTIAIRDTKTGSELKVLRAKDLNVVGAAAFSPEGTQIALGSSDGAVRILDMADGKEVLTLKSRKHGLATFSPDGRWIVSIDAGNSLVVWDAQTGAEVRMLKGHEDSIWSYAISPDSSRIVSGAKDNTIRVWDLTTGTELMLLRGHRERVTSVAYSPDGRHFVSGSWDRTIKVWDSSAGIELMTLRGHEHRIADVEWSPDGEHIVSCSRAIRVWDAKTGEELKILRGHEDEVTCVEFQPASGQIITCSKDETLKVWDLTVNREYLHIAGRVWRGVDFSSDGKQLVSGGINGIMKILDVSSGTELNTFVCANAVCKESWANALPDARFSPDGKRIFSSQEKKGTVWNAATGEELLSFPANVEDVNVGNVMAVFSPDGKYIVSWREETWNEDHDEYAINLRDASTGEKIWTVTAHAKVIEDVVFGPDGKCLATCAIDESVRLWDVQKGESIRELNHPGGCSALAFSQDGLSIASGGSDVDKTIRIWETESGDQIKMLEGSSRGIWSLRFSPDGKRLVSLDKGTTVKLWDVTSGGEVITVRKPQGFSPTSAIALSPDGKTIALGTNHGIALLESEPPPDNYESRRAGAAAREVVDKLHEEQGLYSKVIDELEADESLHESVRKLALRIAKARLWEDEEEGEEVDR